MAYMLQPMLKIRAMREDRAQADLAAARNARAMAEREREERREDYARYEETKEERRDAIYATVMNKVITREGLDVMQEGVARIDEEGSLLRDNIRQAEAVVTERLGQEDEAHGAYVFAMKNRKKIEEHRAIWAEAENREAERRTEAELEDFTGRKIVSDDDDAAD